MAAILALAMLAGCANGATERLNISGSTTVQPLAERLAEAFELANPDTNITVAGGGSSQGIKDARDGISDIGTASRELNPEETSWVIPHVIARDGIAIVVHPSNPVSGLTTTQVKDIFSGAITNWSEVGGPDETITVIAREEGSGTRAAFEEMVMGSDLITNQAILQPSNGALKTAVSTTPQSIGFLSFGYLEQGVVKALDINGVPCTAENAKNGTYPIVRPLLFVTLGEPEGLAKTFIDFVLSDEGQAIVEEEGYLSVK